MNRIIWITADYFMDTDIQLVPYLLEEYKLNIDWYLITTKNSKVELRNSHIKNVYKLKYRHRDIRLFLEFKQIFKEINIKEADVIYSNFMGYPYYYPALWMAKRNKQPLIHGAHNVIAYPVWPWHLKMAVNMIFHFNHHFQLFSKFTYEWFKKNYPKKSCFYAPMVVKHFGKVRTNNYIVDDSKVNLLFFGNIAGNKRLDLLIEAVKNLPKEVREKVHLNICGNCRMKKDEFIRQIGDCKSITTYFKRVPDEEIPELFSKHQFLMLPYEDVAQSGPHMIAYAYNLPVIASDIEGFVERIVNEENGYIFKSGDVQSLIDVICKAVALKNERYMEMKRNLSTYVEENFSLKAVADKYVEYIKSIS